MKASPILVNWHAENAPIWSADFQPHGKGRLATAGGDNNVRVCGSRALWLPKLTVIVMEDRSRGGGSKDRIPCYTSPT